MKNILALSLLIGLFIGCQKEHNTPVNADVKAAFSFKPGSYWIYRDSLSGEMDSMYVTSIKGSRVDNGQQTWDFITVNMYRVNIASMSDPILTVIGMDRSGFEVGDGYITDSDFPFKNSTYTNISDTIYIYNSFYYYIENIAENTYGPFIENYYMSAEIGIVKISTNYPDKINKIFELIRYKIIK